MEQRSRVNVEDLYIRQDTLTDPGAQAGAYDDLPNTVAALREIVAELIVHVAWADRYGIPPDAPMVRETQAVAARLKLIQASCPGSLTAKRPPSRRTFGTCRDYALLLCSMLRHRSIAARVRCGFATYFAAERYEDHWICEYWVADEERWAQVDGQLDRLLIDQLRVTFDCADLPRGSFLSAARAWRMVRSHDAAADRFGHVSATGLWFLRVNLIRDVLSLTNRQMSAWDSWRDATETSKVLDNGTLAELDRLADAVTAFEDGYGPFAPVSEATSRSTMPPWRS